MTLNSLPCFGKEEEFSFSIEVWENDGNGSDNCSIYTENSICESCAMVQHCVIKALQKYSEKLKSPVSSIKFLNQWANNNQILC